MPGPPRRMSPRAGGGGGEGGRVVGLVAGPWRGWLVGMDPFSHPQLARGVKWTPRASRRLTKAMQPLLRRCARA
eukprot:1581820-Prymnesium_polylepis.1